MNCSMPACGTPDSPWATDIIRLSLDAVVFALAELHPNRVDRRQIDNIKAHAGNVGQAGFEIGKRAVRIGGWSPSSAGTVRTTH